MRSSADNPSPNSWPFTFTARVLVPGGLFHDGSFGSCVLPCRYLCVIFGGCVAAASAIDAQAVPAVEMNWSWP